MRPDNPKCETCVAWEPPKNMSVNGYCHLTIDTLPKVSTDWCMKHETPEEWQARKAPRYKVDEAWTPVALEGYGAHIGCNPNFPCSTGCTPGVTSRRTE